MVILPFHQGTPEWLAARAKYFCSSEAPVMMGATKFQLRNELLQYKATDVENEYSEWVKKNLFERGHAAEASARKIVESILKAPLLPLTCTTDDGYLLASFDGINEDLHVGWEHKLWNADLAEHQVKSKSLDPLYYWQLEHQALVGKLDYIIFTCSDGTRENMVHMKYVPVPGRAEQLLAGWAQFKEDLTNYKHVEIIPAPIAKPILALPALSIHVNGAITLTDNLKLFGERLESFIDGLDKNPSDDQAFADAEQAIKVLGTAETVLEAAKSSALAQTASIDEMTRTVALYASQARTTRLMLEKLVKTRKEQIRGEIVLAGKTAFTDHVASLNKRLGKPYMPIVPADFIGVIKNKRTIASLRDAVDTELARAKIEANAIADKIQWNMSTLATFPECAFLFADAAQLVMKSPEDLYMLVKSRIAAHKIAEQQRLDAEREKIRAEEADKLVKEQARIETERERKAMAARVPDNIGDVGLPMSVQPSPPAPAMAPIKTPIRAALQDQIRSVLLYLEVDELLQIADLIRAIKAGREARKQA